MITAEWYSQADFAFTRKHDIWLLGYLPLEGRWPDEPDEYVTDMFDKETKKRIQIVKMRGSSMDMVRVQRTRRRHATFESPAQIAGELEIRLARLGLDRYLVEERYTMGILEEDLAYKLGMPVSNIYRHLNSALWYISGWKRKRMSYSRWKRQGSYAQKVGKMSLISSI